jgi:hypothetical protein
MNKLAILVLAALPAACTVEDAPSAKATETAMEASATIEKSVRHVACGCSSEIGKACGNYVEIDGTFIEFAKEGAHSLGTMEWCGRDGVQAEVAGSIADGEFLASLLKEIE